MLSVIVTLLGTARYRTAYDLPAFSGVRHTSGNRYAIGYRSVSLCIRFTHRYRSLSGSYYLLFCCTLPVRRCALKTEHCVYSAFTIWHSLSLRFGQAFGLLVSVSLMPLSTYTSDLSTT